MKSFQLPHTGDFYGWRVEMLDVKGRILFSFTQKISGTELATAKSRGCVMSDEEALEKLRLATEETARKKYENSDYSFGQSFEGFYSPCGSN